jgi:hypothetical protein
MTENQARKLLAKLLRRLTPGSVLHLLADLYAEHADQACRQGDSVLYDRCRLVQHTLIVVGMGLDAAMPS